MPEKVYLHHELVFFFCQLKQSFTILLWLPEILEIAYSDYASKVFIQLSLSFIPPTLFSLSFIFILAILSCFSL